MSYDKHNRQKFICGWPTPCSETEGCAHNQHAQTRALYEKRSVVSSLNSLKLRKLEKMTLDLQEELKTASEEDQLIILTRIQKLQKVRRQLADHIGTIVLK